MQKNELMFEKYVILYESKTTRIMRRGERRFEKYVILYESKTKISSES
mgnify:FL=1